MLWTGRLKKKPLIKIRNTANKQTIFISPRKTLSQSRTQEKGLPFLLFFYKVKRIQANVFSHRNSYSVDQKSFLFVRIGFLNIGHAQMRRTASTAMWA